MKPKIFIGDIYKLTKEKVDYKPEFVIKNSGIDALLCGDVCGRIPSTIQSIDDQSEIYKKQAILIKLSGEYDLISKFVEVLEIKNNRIIVDKKNIILSTPFCLNSLFVDEESLEPYFYKNKKDLVKVLKK